MSETTPSQPPPQATPALPSQTGTERVSQNGLVGFFDILGYQAFLEANTPETAAEKVLDTLPKLDKGMPDKMLKLFRTEGVEHVAGFVNKINWLVFSDTVLLTLDLSEVTGPELQDLHWAVFLTQSCILWKSMFEFGLPLRGAITKGPYLVQKSCFAGRPIVEAYKLASDINCAGVVIDASVIEWSKAKTTNHLTPNALHFNYSFPSKTRGFVENAALNVTFWPQDNQQRWAGDIRQLVHESFWAHSKSVGPGVPEKIENTERLLRFLKMKWPAGFSNRANVQT